jgi:hypothetical protein
VRVTPQNVTPGHKFHYLTRSFPFVVVFLQSVRWFDAETIGAAAIASLAAFVPTSEEGSKVTAFVLKKYAQQLQQLEDQRRKEQGTRYVLVVTAS